MKHVILILLHATCILCNQAICNEKENNEDISNFVAEFEMTWHPGGAEKQENIPLAPGCFRVYRIETEPNLPEDLKSPLGSNVEYGLATFLDYGKTKFVCGLKKSHEKVVGFDELYIDLNHNGLLEKTEMFKGTYHDSTMGPNVIDCYYGPVDLPLNDWNGQRIHRVFAWYHMLNAFDTGEFYFNSHCYLDGRIRLGDKEIEIVLIDYNCDGRYSPGRVNPEWTGIFVDQRENDYDRIGWDIDGNGEIHYTEQHYLGSCTIYNNRAYQIDSSPDGRKVTVRELKVPMGYLRMPAKKAYVRLVSELWPVTLNMSDGVTAIPTGTYQVDYASIEEPNDSGGFVRTAKLGIYFEKPWQINPGATTKIERQMLIVTEQDKQKYQEKIRAMRALGAEPQVEPLLNKPFGDISEFGLESDTNATKEKSVLLCFFDMNQRPSRNCILQLSKRAQELKAKDIVIAAVQTSKIDQEQLDEWAKENNINFPVGMIQADKEQTYINWGIKSLPWLILTNAEHIVRAEGFAISELDEKIKQ